MVGCLNQRRGKPRQPEWLPQVVDRVAVGGVSLPCGETPIDACGKTLASLTHIRSRCSFCPGRKKGTQCGTGHSVTANSATAPATVSGEQRLIVPLEQSGKASPRDDPQVRRPAGYAPLERAPSRASG